MSTLATVSFVLFLSLSFGWGAARLVCLVAMRRESWRSRWMATFALLPAAAAIALAAALLVPGLGNACHCAAHEHHRHLCLAHPTFTVAVSAVGAVGLAWLGLAIARAAEVLRDAWRTRAWLRTLAGQVEVRRGVRLLITSDTSPRAITAGLLRPRTHITSALWQGLDEAERDAVALHEAAHVERRDALTLLALHVAVAFLPAPLAAQMVNRWKIAAEVACDGAAAARLGDPTVIARALLRCAKLRIAAPPATALGVASGPLEHRIRALLEQAPARSAGARSDLVTACFAACSIVMAAAGAPGDALHHAVETLFAFVL